ncbi:MAG: Acg family FMN-binding oxidoreductase [Caldilineaceae bacterium]
MQNTIQSRPNLSRRNLLKVLAAAGVTAASGYALFEYAPWLNYDQQASQARRPFAQDAAPAARPAQMRELVRYATLAASGHNTQPWQFAINDNAIAIHPDLTRHLPAVDPSDRELWISLGCALENLLVAARADSYAAEVIYPDAADFIQVRLTPDSAQSSPLFDAIPLRQNTRSAYDGQLIKSADLDQVQALGLEPGVGLHFVTTPTELETVLDYVNQGNLHQYADKAFIAELIDWIRFNQKEALASLDGLNSRSAGSPAVPRWLGQMFVAGTKPQQQADADAKKLRSSPGAVVVTSTTEDKTAWVRTGQVYERLALTMTSLNIKSAFLNQPIEVTAVRGQFQSALGLGTALPQLLVRFGYAAAMTRSLRRPLEQVLVQS